MGTHSTKPGARLPRRALKIHQLPRLMGEPNRHPNSNPAHYALVGRSAHGRRTYICRLNQVARLFEFASYEDVPWALLRHEHLNYVVQELRLRKVAPTTINTTLAALRAVSREAFTLGLMNGDDLAQLLHVKRERDLRLPAGRHVPGRDIQALVQVCARDETPAGIRDTAIIGLLYVCGLRREEVVKLQLAHYDENNNTFRFADKQKRERQCWPDTGTRNAILDWLELRGSHEGPLFHPVLKGGRIRFRGLTDQAVYNMIQKRVKQAGVRACSPHDFRRSFVTNLLENNVDVLIAQRLAGHVSPATTMKYDRRK